MMHEMYIESLIIENSERSGGYLSYLAAISIRSAAFPVTLIFLKMYDIAAMGEPVHRKSDRMVIHAWLLSQGACTMRPIIGRTYIVIVFAASFLKT